MGIETTVASFRFKEWALVIMDWTIRAYDPLVRNRTQAVELALWAWGEAHCMDESLPVIITQLQRLLCKHKTSAQLQLVFHENANPPCYPRFGNYKEAV